MASECENDNIVIEESLRESFYDFIDRQVEVVFKDVFNRWALQFINMDQNLNEVKTLKKDLMNAFHEWTKLKLPREVLLVLPEICPNLLELIFAELGNQSDDEDNDLTEIASDCFIQLLVVIKKVGGTNLNNVLLSKVPMLANKVK